MPFSATLVRLYTGIHGLDGSPADVTGAPLVSAGLVRFVRPVSEADPIQIASPGVEVGRSSIARVAYGERRTERAGRCRTEQYASLLITSGGLCHAVSRTESNQCANGDAIHRCYLPRVGYHDETTP